MALKKKVKKPNLDQNYASEHELGVPPNTKRPLLEDVLIDDNEYEYKQVEGPNSLRELINESTKPLKK
jgi:hypothetical protein